MAAQKYQEEELKIYGILVYDLNFSFSRQKLIIEITIPGSRIASFILQSTRLD